MDSIPGYVINTLYDLEKNQLIPLCLTFSSCTMKLTRHPFFPSIAMFVLCLAQWVSDLSLELLNIMIIVNYSNSLANLLVHIHHASEEAELPWTSREIKNLDKQASQV